MITENIALLVERGHCARPPKKRRNTTIADGRWIVVGIRSSDGRSKIFGKRWNASAWMEDRKRRNDRHDWARIYCFYLRAMEDPGLNCGGLLPLIK